MCRAFSCLEKCMRYNTGNPVEPNGSSDPRDLFDNAGNLDLAVNGQAVSWTDRTGKSRKSFAGMEADFQTALANTGYIYVGPYAAGLSLTLPNEVFDRAGEFWRAKPGVTLPLTLTGTWATDQNNVVSVGDAALRSELAAITGTTKVGYQQAGRTVDTRLRESPSVTDKGASTAIMDNKTAVESAISEAGNPGTVLVPEGQFKLSAMPSNPTGVEFEGPGALMVPAPYPADGYRQFNTYANRDIYGVGREYLKRPYEYMQLSQSSNGGRLHIYMYGDSTVIGYNGESQSYNPLDQVKGIFKKKGIPNVSVTMRAIGGSTIDVMQPIAVADLSNANKPGLYILKSFINEAGAPLATRLEDARVKLDNFLNAVRSSVGGTQGDLGIIVMGGNSTNDTAHQRDFTWHEQYRNMCIATCRKYGAAYFDTYAVLQDTINAPSVGYLDQPYPSQLLYGVHPLDEMQAQIWGIMLDWAFPDGTLSAMRTNGYHNAGNVSMVVPVGALISQFDFGITQFSALLAQGFPINGTCITYRAVDQPGLQILHPFDGGSRIMTRTANTTTGAWNNWTGLVHLPAELSFQNGWADYNDATTVHSAGFVLTADGFVEMLGSVKGGAITAGTVVCVLPVGFRPLYNETCITYSGDASGFAAWLIETNGNVKGLKGLSAGATSLNGIKFRRGN